MAALFGHAASGWPGPDGRSSRSLATAPSAPQPLVVYPSGLRTAMLLRSGRCFSGSSTLIPRSILQCCTWTPRLRSMAFSISPGCLRRINRMPPTGGSSSRWPSRWKVSLCRLPRYRHTSRWKRLVPGPPTACTFVLAIVGPTSSPRLAPRSIPMVLLVILARPALKGFSARLFPGLAGACPCWSTPPCCLPGRPLASLVGFLGFVGTWWSTTSSIKCDAVVAFGLLVVVL